jgi:hypothetical protein
MRVLLVITLQLSCAVATVTAHPEPPVAEADAAGADAAGADAADGNAAGAEKTVEWTRAFSPISAADADRALVFMVITNDDPTIARPPAEDSPRRIDGNLWCAAVFARSFRKACDVRQDLRGLAVVQSLPVGMPAELTGGKLRNRPARAIVAVCDGSYRLLGFTVGVPDTDGLLTLIEDAEDVRSLSQMLGKERDKLIAAVAQRSGERMGRIWRGALEEMIVVMGDGRFDDNADVPGATAQQQAGRLALLSETYQPYYLADAQLRFGLTETADQTRLVILEQHPEARRPWVNATMPFLASEDFLTLWNPLCESLWGFQPITMNAADPELLQWWDSLIDTEAVVFSLQPPLLARREPWPPVNAATKTNRRALGWKDVQELVVQLSHRTIDAQQLFRLIHSRGLPPVDIQLPTTARYLLFEPGKKTALVVREGEPPGRFVGRLKRAK